MTKQNDAAGQTLFCAVLACVCFGQKSIKVQRDGWSEKVGVVVGHLGVRCEEVK